MHNDYAPSAIHWAREGQLSHLRSRLVNTATLAEVGASLGLGEALLVGKGVESRGGRTLTSLLADATEAVIGAIYLDSDFGTAQRITRCLLESRMEALAISDERNDGWLDPRGRLQHLVQKSHGKPHLPTRSSRRPARTTRPRLPSKCGLLDKY